jgi:hypothetical protein
LSEVSSTGVFTFTQSTSELANIPPGEIIVGEPTVATQDGTLGKVTSISSGNGETVVNTERVTLEEAIQQ